MHDRSPIAKYHRIEVTLAERIRNGFYAQERLPSERVLAKEFGVARVTIRHALERLSDQGLVARRERSGTSLLVGTQAANRPRLLREHVNQFLDRGRPDQRKVLRFHSMAATAAVAEKLCMPAGSQVLRIVRLRSRSDMPLTYTESLIPDRLAHVLDRRTLSRKPLIQALETAGVRIGAARQSVRAERCPEDIAHFLGLAIHEPVLRLERTVFDEDDVPIQLLWGWYRADRFEVQMHMSRSDDATRVWIGQR